MLKEVGTSGQISLGKKYAGQLFDVQTTEDGAFVLRPVKVVPMKPSAQEAQPPYTMQAEPAFTQQSTRDWAQAHAQDIDAYNTWAMQTEPYAQRVRRWREESTMPTVNPDPAHGTV